MTKKANHRLPKPKEHEISLLALAEMFPDEETATLWFEDLFWPEGRCCGHCGAMNTKETPNGKPMAYWCPDCRSYFNVKTGTVLQRTYVPLQKWAYALYLFVTSVKGIPSTRLATYIDVSQKTAWYMMHRLREAWADSGVDEIDGMDKFLGPVEVDETYVGGKVGNMSNSRRAALRAGRGYVDNKGKVVGLKDRDTGQVRTAVVDRVDQATMDAFISEFTDPNAEVFTDGAKVYKGIRRKGQHRSVNHSIRQYVDGKVHTNGIESFWATVKRAYVGTFHHISIQHLERYVTEFAGKHNVRDLTITAALSTLVTHLVGKSLSYRDLTGTTNAAKLAKAAKIEKASMDWWPPTMAEVEAEARRKRAKLTESWDEPPKPYPRIRKAGPVTIHVTPRSKRVKGKKEW